MPAAPATRAKTAARAAARTYWLKRSGRRRQPLRAAARAGQIAAWIGAAGVGWADIQTERFGLVGRVGISPIADDFGWFQVSTGSRL
jgi:hypothetical protein